MICISWVYSILSFFSVTSLFILFWSMWTVQMSLILWASYFHSAVFSNSSYINCCFYYTVMDFPLHQVVRVLGTAISVLVPQECESISDLGCLWNICCLHQYINRRQSQRDTLRKNYFCYTVIRFSRRSWICILLFTGDPEFCALLLVTSDLYLFIPDSSWRLTFSETVVRDRLTGTYTTPLPAPFNW